MNSFGDKLYDITLNAYSTVYNAARQESVNDLLSSLMNDAEKPFYGDLLTGASFYPGLIFSIWA